LNADNRQGRRTGVKVQLPPERLDSRRIFSREARRLSADEVRLWNQRNHPLLEQYGLEIASVMVLPVARATGLATGTPPPGAGPLQTGMRDRLLLAASLGALSVSMSGRGDLLARRPEERDAAKKSIKENNDRNSTAAMTEALYALSDASPDVSLRIAIGEGARLKPGEKGGNPTLYSGQVIGAGAKQYAIAVDTVEGTSKSTLFDHSCGTLLYITESRIPAVPDVYFDKCQIRGVDGVTVADPLEKVVEAVMEARGTREVNFFALDRPRHPIDRMLSLGANMRIDTDGDAYPVIAAGLEWGVYPDNLRPLDGVCGNIGGAAEMIASAAGGWYLGVRSSARFCASKIRRWEERYDLSAQDEAVVRAGGFDPSRVYRIEDLVPGIAGADAAFVAAAISDNWHIPCLNAVFVGGNFATVSALFIGAAGTADLYGIVFSYRQPLERTVETITPILTRILGIPAAEIPGAVRGALSSPAGARRLRHEMATSYYTHITELPGGRMRLDLSAAAKVESAEALAFLKAVTEAAPEWFAD
jgi:fructose-1,6-bisphosphatase/sedoheptulose 1,7-bisphosphatase-like protein